MGGGLFGVGFVGLGVMYDFGDECFVLGWDVDWLGEVSVVEVLFDGILLFIECGD